MIPQNPTRIRPGWPMGSVPTSLERAKAAAQAVIEAMEVAPSSTPEEIANAYIATNGKAAFDAFALAMIGLAVSK